MCQPGRDSNPGLSYTAPKQVMGLTNSWWPGPTKGTGHKAPVAHTGCQATGSSRPSPAGALDFWVGPAGCSPWPSSSGLEAVTLPCCGLAGAETADPQGYRVSWAWGRLGSQGHWAGGAHRALAMWLVNICSESHMCPDYFVTVNFWIKH